MLHESAINICYAFIIPYLLVMCLVNRHYVPVAQMPYASAPLTLFLYQGARSTFGLAVAVGGLFNQHVGAIG